MTLTEEERKTFIMWLRDEARTNRALVSQMMKISTQKAIVENYNRKAIAADIIATVLESMEVQSISSPEDE